MLLFMIHLKITNSWEGWRILLASIKNMGIWNNKGVAGENSLFLFIQQKNNVGIFFN